jgi:hypothetical protein
MFANTWQDAIVSGRREKEYSGTIIPTLHGVRRLGLCARHVLGAGLWPRPRAAHSAVQRSGVLLAGVHFMAQTGGLARPLSTRLPGLRLFGRSLLPLHVYRQTRPPGWSSSGLRADPALLPATRSRRRRIPQFSSFVDGVDRRRNSVCLSRAAVNCCRRRCRHRGRIRSSGTTAPAHPVSALKTPLRLVRSKRNSLLSAAKVTRKGTQQGIMNFSTCRARRSGDVAGAELDQCHFCQVYITSVCLLLSLVGVLESVVERELWYRRGTL